MGEVYRAHDPRLGRDVALKVLPSEMSGDRSRLERFTREARAIAALNHPHIITIYSTEEAEGLKFFTMELVEGQTLDALIPPNGLPVARFLELAIPLADALHAAHEKQITHRDLKPANVMVGRDGRVKVLDFGLATPLGPALGPADMVTSPQVTTPGMVIGTMPYMSPEQVEGRPLDHRTDVFSLGVMFYEMLTGSRPFSGDSPAQLMSSILRDAPRAASALRAEVPDALSRLIDRCLEKRPEDRVQTARDVFNELRHVQRQTESTAHRTAAGPAPAVAVTSGGLPAFDLHWVAVLPFTTSRAGDEVTALAEGLTEDITAGLARFPYLSVVTAHSVRQHNTATADPRQVGQALGARYLIEGGIRPAGQGVRISARLIDASTGAQLWSETYTHALQPDTVLAIQDDVTDRIVATVADVHGALMRSLSLGVSARPFAEVRFEELRFRYWSYHRQHAPVEHGLLRDRFEQLVEQQPGVAPFWAALAHLYLHEYGFHFNTRPEPLARARRAAERSLEIDSMNQHAWEALAFNYFFEHDRDGFSHAVDRVLALNPRNANAMALMGTLSVHAGDYDRGEALATRAMAINPDHPGWYHFAIANRSYVLRDYEAALRAAKRINMPHHLWAHLQLAMAAGQLGLASEAANALGTVFSLAPEFADEETIITASRVWKWRADDAEHMVEGYRKAVALRGTRSAPMVRPSSGSEVRPKSGGRSDPSDLSLMVLPFTSRGTRDADAFAQALTDDVTTGLSRFCYLRVVLPSQDAGAAPPGAARYRLEGNVRREAITLRVTARLIDGSTGAQLWADSYDQSMATNLRKRVHTRMQAHGIAPPFRRTKPTEDVASRIVATVADVNGVLMRSMASSLKQRRLEDLDVSDLVVRFHTYREHFDPAEHVALRNRLTAALEREPDHADGWACLSSLFEHEYSHGLNPLPHSLDRARDAAERATRLNPVSQEAWRATASVAFFSRDAGTVHAATERAIAINPLNTATVAACGMLLAHAGEWERGLEIIRQAMRPNPHYPGWLYFPFAIYHFRRREYAESLKFVKQVNMPLFPKLHLHIAAAAAPLGLRDEARSALEALARLGVATDDDSVRRIFASWTWDAEELDHIVDGVRQARVLASEND
jgi:serine/threonine-protein kinase